MPAPKRRLSRRTHEEEAAPESAVATLDPAEESPTEIEPTSVPQETDSAAAAPIPNQIAPDPKDRQDDGELARAMRKTEMYTRLRLEREPKVLVRLPRTLTNAQSRLIAESAVPVVVNGVRYNIPRGVSVPVPESIARILERAGYLDGSEASLNIGPAPQVVMHWPGGSH